jgi:hypothetical protein
MAGLVPAIHVFATAAQKEDVDPRDKPGDDSFSFGRDSVHDFFLPGRMPMYFEMMPSITSSAPPPMEARRLSR